VAPSSRSIPREAFRQRRLYDGKESAYVPLYQDEAVYRRSLSEHIAAARSHGMLGCSLKSVRNLRELDRLGLKKGEKVLDAGSGGGLLLNQLKARYGVDGWGVDIAPLAVQRARQCGDPGIHYRVGALEQLPFKTGFFDAVVSFDVLEHVEDKEAVLKEMLRVLKPGGRFLFYAISKGDFLTWHWFLRKISGNRLGRDDEAGHKYEQFLDAGETRRQLASMGAGDLSIGYLHSFFSLALDEAVVWAAMRRGRGATEKSPAATPAKQMRQEAPVKIPGSKLLVYRGLRVLAPCIEALELPWKTFGLANGFFVRGRKAI